MDGILNINGTTRNKRESAFFPTHVGGFETLHVSSFLNKPELVSYIKRKPRGKFLLRIDYSIIFPYMNL